MNLKTIMKHLTTGFTAGLRAGILTALTAFAFSASSQTLNVHLNDGSVTSFPVAEVDSVVVEPAEVAPIFIELADIKAASVQVTVDCPDPSVRYYFDFCTVSDYERYNHDIAAIIEGYIASQLKRYQGQLTISQLLEAMLDSGHCSERVSGLPALTSMVAYAMPVDESGKCYGKATTVEFKTLEPGNPADCTFEITASYITDDGCTVNIYPSDESVPYWYGVYPKDAYPGDFAMAASVTEAFRQSANEYGMDLKEFVSRICYMGNTQQIESGLDPETTFYIYAFPLTPEGENAGRMAKVQFTTGQQGLSDAEISLSYRYFDGNELIAKDPQTYAKYKDAIMVEARVNPNTTATHWVVGLAANDLSDATTYPDESTKQALLSGMGRVDLESMTFVARYGVATFLYFAADFAGSDGVLKRLPVDFTKEGASPVDELDAAPANRLRHRAAAEAFSLPAVKSAAAMRLTPRPASRFRALDLD